MKSAIYVILALIIGFGIAFGTFTAYSYHEEPLANDEVTNLNLTLDSKGNFSGNFRCEKNGREICGIEYEVEDGNLYITVLATAGDKKALETDKDGYATLKIEGLSGINKVYYRADEKDIPLTVN